MASKEELSEQLAITTKLAAAVDQMAKSMSRVESSYDSQIGAVEKLTRAIEQLKGQDLSQLNSTKLDNVQKEFKQTEKQVTGLTGRMKDLGIQMSKKFPTSAAAGAAALSGFVQGIRNVLALSKGVTGFFSSFVDGAANIAASIISIPFKMFNALVDTAAAAGGGMNELAQAIENLRKEMGDLKGPGAHAVMETSKTLQGFSDTGLSSWRVFGTLAERLELVTKVATAMGSTFGVLRGEFEKNGGALLAFQKGLGVSDEGMKAIGDRAISIGKPMAKVFLDMTKQTLALGKAFDIDQKLIGKDMTKALMDVKHFGAMTVKEIGQASVYARKLGLELDKITGTLDAFETFDTAAENAAKLSQAFGVNIDAFKMMEAQNPAEQMDMLRKSFRDAGVDASKFTRQQAKLLAQSTGLDEATVRQAMSAENYGVSLDDIKKKSADAEKKTMTQAEAMGKLADSIERMVKSGGGQEGGFWQQFVKGFLGGIQASKEFREIIWNIKKSLQLVYFEGVRLGKAFVEMFPGIKEFLQGIADFFKPEKFKRLVGGVVDVLKDWMKGLSDPNGKASFSGLMDKLKEKFFDFFDGQSGSGKKMLDGFKTVMKTVSKIISEGIIWVSDKIGEGIGFVTDLLTGKKKLDTSGAGGALGFFGQIMEPMINALSHAWDVIAPALWELIKALGKKLFEFLKSDEFIGFIKPAIPYLAAALFGPAFGRAIVGAATAGLAKGAMAMIAGGGKKMFSVVSDKVGEIAGASNAPKIAPKLPDAPDAAAAGKSGQALSEAGKGISWSAVLKFLVGFAGVVAVGMAAVFGSVAIIRAFNITPKELAMAIAAVGAAALAMLPVAITLAIVSKFPLDPASAAIGILAIGLAVLAMVGVLALTYLALKELDLGKLKTISEIMWEMSKVFMAAGVIVLVAMGIGAIILASVGIGAAALAIGLAAMASAVAVMGAAVISIMTQLDKVPMGPGFKDKVDAFVKIMDSVTNFAKNITAILEAVKPSFISLIQGKDDTTARIQAVTGMIRAMIGEPGGAGIIGMIETIVKALTALSEGGPRMLDAAKAFADILGAMGNLAGAMKPPDAMFKAVDSMWSSAKDVQDAIQKTTDFAGAITQNLKGLIDVFVEKVMPIVQGGGRGLSDQQIKGAAAVGQLLGAVTQIAQGMQPSASTIQNMRDVSKNVIASGEDSSLKPENMQALGAYVNQIASGLKLLLPAVIGAMEPLLKILGTWHFTESDAKAMSAVGPLLQQLLVMVQSVVGQTSQFGQQAGGVDKVGAVNQFLNKLGDVMPGFMKSISDSLPLLFDALKGGIAKISTGFDPKTLEAGMKTIGTVFGIIQEIPKLINSMATGTDKAKPQDIAGKGLQFAQVINEVARFFGFIVGGSTGNGLNGGIPLQMLAAALKSDVIKNLGGMKDRVESLKSLFGLIGEIVKVVKDVQEQVPTGGVSGSASGKMMKAIDEVGTFLKNVTLGDGTEKMSGLSSVYWALKSPVVTQLAGMKGTIEGLKATFTLIGEIVKVVGNDVGVFDEWKATQNIAKVATFLNRMFHPGWKWEGLGGPVLSAAYNALETGKDAVKGVLAAKTTLAGLPDLFKTFNDIANQAQSMDGLTKFNEVDVSSKIAKLGTFLKLIVDEKMGGLSDIAKTAPIMANYAKAIKTGGIIPALEAVAEIVKKTQELDDALAKLPNIGAEGAAVKLAAVAKAAGLGGKAVYTVKSKEVVINMYVTVTMDTGEVEKVMINRANSTIRQRLDFMADQNKDGPLIMPKGTSYSGPFGSLGAAGAPADGDSGK